MLSLGKSNPMSPLAVAPKIASMIAWIKTSPSEWPIDPTLLFILTPPITKLSASPYWLAS